VVFSVNCELCASVCFFVRVQLPIGHESWSRHIVIRHENITTKCNGMKFFVCLFVFPASSWLGFFFFVKVLCHKWYFQHDRSKQNGGWHYIQMM
jgi:hypothetical protein